MSVISVTAMPAFAGVVDSEASYDSSFSESLSLGSARPEVSEIRKLEPLSEEKSERGMDSSRSLGVLFPEAIAQTPSNPSEPNAPEDDLNLDPAILEDSPLFQRWTEEVPDVLSEIRRDPSFRTRLRVGYTHFSDDDSEGGLMVGVEDLWIGRTGLSANAHYQTSFEGEQSTYGADLRYYILPLGSSVNLAPVLGYRHVETEDATTDGVNVGARLVVSLSRTGAADLAVTQSWVSPGSEAEISLTDFSLGYAVTPDLRLSTDVQWQNSRERQDTRLGILLEWLL